MASLAAALVLALLPGTPAACGSLLAPLFPPGIGVSCAAAQVGWLPEVVAGIVVGLLLLGAGAAMTPTGRSRRGR